MKFCRIALVVCTVGCLITAPAWTQALNDKDTQAYMDMMRKDLRTQKQSLVDQAMALEAAQKAQFWTIYDGYQKELNAIWDQRIANIKKYADNFDKMTDVIADELANTMLNIEGQKTALRKKYYAEYKTKMGARVAARFLQTEATIGAMMEIQIGTKIPILQ
jgi:PBP1b-binding outer membrane lipoprotein LpoB